jgi:anti-anti-sigma factor
MLFGSEEGRRDAVLSFVRSGLDHHEKVVYFAADERHGEVVGHFAAAGNDICEALAEGILSVRASSDGHLAGGDFDAEQMYVTLRDEIAMACNDGFSACRFAGEMDWIHAPGVDRRAVVDYEHQVDALLRETGSAALCQYDHREVDLATVRDCVEVHHLVLAERNRDGGAACELLIERGPNGETVLRGEIDGGSCESLSLSLSKAIARTDDLRLDLGDLSFIGAAGLQVIRDSARTIEALGGRMTLLSARPVVRQVVGLMGFEDSVVLEEAI